MCRVNFKFDDNVSPEIAKKVEQRINDEIQLEKSWAKWDAVIDITCGVTGGMSSMVNDDMPIDKYKQVMFMIEELLDNELISFTQADA